MFLTKHITLYTCRTQRGCHTLKLIGRILKEAMPFSRQSESRFSYSFKTVVDFMVDIFNLLRYYIVCIGSQLPTFRDNLSFLSSSIKQSKTSACILQVQTRKSVSKPNFYRVEYVAERPPLISVFIQQFPSSAYLPAYFISARKNVGRLSKDGILLFFKIF